MLDVRDLDDIDVQRDYLYYIGPIGGGMNDSLYKLLNATNMKTFFPNKKTSNIPLKWGGRVINISGTDESTKEGNLEFLMVEGSDILNFIQTLAMKCWGFKPKSFKELESNWKSYDYYSSLRGEKSYVSNDYDESRYFAFPESEQKFDFWIFQVRSDKLVVTRKVKVINAKVRGFEVTPLSKEGNGFCRITVNLVWEDSIIHHERTHKQKVINEKNNISRIVDEL